MTKKKVMRNFGRQNEKFCEKKNVIQKSWSAKFFSVPPKLDARSPPLHMTIVIIQGVDVVIVTIAIITLHNMILCHRVLTAIITLIISIIVITITIINKTISHIIMIKQ